MEFLKNNRLFDFIYGGKTFDECEFKVTQKQDGNTVTTVYDFADGLKVTNIAKKYEKFGAYEWVNYFENTSSKPTEIISELWDASVSMPMVHEEPRKWQSFFPDAETATKIYNPSGSTWTAMEFYTNINKIEGSGRINHIYPDTTKSYANKGGRSSDEIAPFFNVHCKNTGIIFAIGWTGQWNAEISRNTDDIVIKTKIEDTNFRLLAGEKIRTSSIVVMPYEGDFVASQNKWRRLVKEEFSIIGSEGRDKYGPLCASVWGGMKTQSVLERIRIIKENKLPFEYIWMDAGWYGKDTEATPDEFEGDWATHTGEWCISPKIHPNGMKDITAAVHDAGMKFLLWFEPERVIYSTPIVQEHPEYFIGCDDCDGDNGNKLLNLGNKEAWEYCFNTISGIIDDLGINCYRQDFNFQPLGYWRKNDSSDRVGITEIKHINGMYKLWDALLEKFPHLIIDNCSSGGRRIDIETLRRSIPLWRSDFQCPANYDVYSAQCHQMGFNTWMPYSGTGSGREYDEYRIRSAYGASMTTNYTYSERDSFGEDKDKLDWIRKYTNEYLKVRPYFSEDFYPLTEISDCTDVWCAMQFDRPSENDGMVQVFRREKSPYDTAVFELGGIDESAEYTFTDIDGGDAFVISGRELKENGLRISIDKKRTAKIYLYKKEI